MSPHRNDERIERGPGSVGMGRLARELLDLARADPQRFGEQVAALDVRQLAELALRLPAERRLELLLHAPKPLRLVRSLPDGELYLTAREVGPIDALPLLHLASASQLIHILDLEAWRGDRFDPARAGAWIAVLLESGEPTLRRFLRQIDDDFLMLLFQRWLRVEPLEFEDTADVHGHGLSESGDERGQVSPDGNYRLRPELAEHVPAVRQIARLYFGDPRAHYEEVLWCAVNDAPSEIEERALHWRNSRLEEHGYPPWDEALQLYAPPTGVRTRGAPPEPVEPDGLAAPRGALRVLATQDPLAHGIDRLSDPQRELALQELTALANRVLVADRADTGDPAQHALAIERATRYVALALEARGVADGEAACVLLERVPLLELFREGYALAAALQPAARRLVSSGWVSRHPRALELLEPPLGERIAALVEPRPSYVEPRADGPSLRRAFRSRAEIEETRAALDLAELIGRVLVDGMGLDPGRILAEAAVRDGEPKRFGTFLLTLMAWHATRGELRGDALPPDVVSAFLRDVASRRTASPQAPERALEGLVTALAQRHGLGPREAALLTAFGRAALERLAAECATLDPGIPPDPRQVGCLLLAPA